MVWNFCYCFNLKENNRKVNMCNKVLSRDRLNKKPHPSSLQSGSSQPEQKKRNFAKIISHPEKTRIWIPNYHKVKHIWYISHRNKNKNKVLGRGSTTQTHLTHVHRSCWAAGDWSAYFGVPKVQHQAVQEFQTAFCHLLPSGVHLQRAGESYTGSHQGNADSFYQGLRNCSTDMGVYKSHMNKLQLPQHVTRAGTPLEVVQTHQATRPVTQAQTGALVIRNQGMATTQPQNALRKHMRAS